MNFLEVFRIMLFIFENLAALTSCFVLAGCSVDDFKKPTPETIAIPASAQSNVEPAVVQVAYKVLYTVQEKSLNSNVEICGYIIREPNSEIKIVGPAVGDQYSCTTPIVYKPNEPLASFHTQGGYDPKARSEIPSVEDLKSAVSEKLDAFIGTPGGRFWYVNHKTAKATLLCGPANCLKADPRATDQTSYEIKKNFSLEELEKIESKG